jgi:hypothetical protein
VLAASSAAPVDGVQASWLPVAEPLELEPAAVWTNAESAGPDCALLGVPFGPTAAVVLGRIGGPEFLPAEVARLAHLARVAQALLP